MLLVSLSLGLSMVMTLVSILCYDYSVRFEWKQQEIKEHLRRKGHMLGTFGFYFLMWAIAAVPALADYFLGLIAALIVYLLMWIYYFLPKNSV